MTRLVLTSLDITKHTDPADSVYLGWWCLPDVSNGPASHGLPPTNVMPYPFDEEEDLLESYQYLQRVYGNLFRQIIENLNSVHGKCGSARYWEIIVGYWFREYLEVLYERYLCIRSAGRLYSGAVVRVLEPDSYVTPVSSRHSYGLNITDRYNHQLFSQIIERLGGFEVLRGGLSSQTRADQVLRIPAVGRAKQLVKMAALFFSRWNDVLAPSAYLPPLTFARLGLRMGFFPTIDVPDFAIRPGPRDPVLRRRLTELQPTDDFEEIVRATLEINFPKVFVEHHADLGRLVKRYYPRRKVRLIVTANSFAVNDSFKLWTAGQIEQHQARFAILQHGGNYGVGEWNSSEDYEAKIADTYLTYGWDDPTRENVYPFVASRYRFDEATERPSGDPSGGILWLLMSLPRYSYTMYSLPVGPQFKVYLEEQARFLSSLNGAARSLVRCKPHALQYGWNDLDRIRKLGGEFELTQKGKTSLGLMKKSRLVVSTYNGTAFLEPFLLNIPTVVFWYPPHWKIRPDARPYYDEFHDLGVLHYTPEAAARHVNTVAGDPREWWGGAAIQQARRRFVQRFVRASKDPYSEWKKMFQRLMA